MGEKRKSIPEFWDLAAGDQIGALFRGAEVAITAQDADFKYVSALNAPFGMPDGLVGRLDNDLLPADLSQTLGACKERALASGKGEAIEISLDRDGDVVWHRIWVEPIPQNGHDRGVLCALVDITRQKTAEEHLRLALIELAHRSKNLLAVVLSVARQSAEESRNLDQFNDRFVGRIHALAISHDVLTEESWRGATVFSLVRSQLQPFEEIADRSSIVGHNAYLKPNAVQYVGLALHELVAHSMVSGALSEPEGRVGFSSTLQEGEPGRPQDLVLRWLETGRPRASPIAGSRFGHALLERIVPAALAGSAKIDESEPGRFVYELRVPSAQFF